MDLEFIKDFYIPLIIATCLCIGYILKNIVETEKVNKYIPLIMGVTGVLLNIWICKDFTPDILLGGLISGLASTGMYEAFKNIVE